MNRNGLKEATPGAPFQPAFGLSGNSASANRELRSHSHSERLYLGTFLLRGFPEVALHLQAEPKIGLGMEGFCEAQSHICGDSGPAVEYPRERWPRDTQVTRDFCDGSASEIVGKYLSGMSRVMHPHGWNSLRLVVILIINEDSIFALKGKCKSPTSVDANGPMTCKIRG